ncbi:MAG: helix-turn-helix domain-containing protein [Gammaproteobacteria bacterium]
MALDDVQFIPSSGEPQWAVLPYGEYVKLKSLIIQQPIVAPVILLPELMTQRIAAGESSIRVWREYRGLSQAALAKAAGISVPYLSQLENRLRSGSKKVLKQVAQGLAIPLDLLCK